MASTYMSSYLGSTCICTYNNREREELIEKMKMVVTGWDEVEEERNVAWILDLACRNESIARGVEKLWAARFVQK